MGAIEVVVEVEGMVFKVGIENDEGIEENMGNIVDSFHKTLAIFVTKMDFGVGVAKVSKALEYSNYFETVVHKFEIMN